MALVQTEMKLLEYNHSMRVSLYFPTDMSAVEGNEVKGVIWLLHGYYGCGQDWMLFTAACRYAADNGYVLVAPDADNSFYADMVCGKPYYTMLTEALPKALARVYNLPTEREKNFICGLSMGGYGAMRIALLNPERFAAVGCFSGALALPEIVQQAATLDLWRKDVMGVLGPDMVIPPDMDLFALTQAKAVELTGSLPRMFVACGKQDYMYEMSARYAELLRALPVDATYKEWDGVHEWSFWDRALAEFIGFIQNDDYAARKRQDWSES